MTLGSSSQRIMLVDDNPANIEILREIFEGEYTIAIARDGLTALSLAKTFRPDLIMLDIMMPGIDGYEVCKRIRADDTLRSVKVVLVSAKKSLEERLEGYESGADDYMTKPFDDEEALSKARVYLRLKKLEELLTLKRSLLGLLASDDRTPLNRIIGPATALAGEAPLSDQERQRFGAVICQNLDRITRCFDQVIEFCNLQSVLQPGSSETIGLREVVLRSLERVAKVAESRGVTIRELHGTEALVNVDTYAAEHVVSTLLLAAVEFSAVGAIVSLTTHSESSNTVMAVSTDKLAAPRSELSRILDLNSDDDLSDSPLQLEGLGHLQLELAIAREQLRLRGGDLNVPEVDSAQELFVVTLPEIVLT